MPYPGTPEFSQMLLEMQITMWQGVALILALGTAVLFAVILGSIAWLCFSEVREAQRRRPAAQEAQRDDNLVTPIAYRDVDRVQARAQARTLPAQHAAWFRRTMLRPRR